MRISIRQLKQIIKEQVEENKHRTWSNHDGDDSPVAYSVHDRMSRKQAQSILVLEDGETYASGGWFITDMTEDEMDRIGDNEKVSTVIDLENDRRAKKIT